MKKPLLLALGVVVLTVLFVFAVVHAAQKAADEMTMNSQMYPTHKKSLVTFTHKKHSVDYKISCAECHHVYKDGKNVHKDGDKVEKCEVCHSKAKAPTGKDVPKLSKQEKIKKYHYSAIHENCKGCHQSLKKAGRPTGPTSCKSCHSKPPEN